MYSLPKANLDYRAAGCLIIVFILSSHRFTNRGTSCANYDAYRISRLAASRIILKNLALSYLTLFKTTFYPNFNLIASLDFAIVLFYITVLISSTSSSAVQMVYDSSRWFWYLPGLLSMSLLTLNSPPISLSSFIAPTRPRRQIWILIYNLTASCSKIETLPKSNATFINFLKVRYSSSYSLAPAFSSTDWSALISGPVSGFIFLLQSYIKNCSSLR
jgi:hypothetical protein